MWLCRLETVAHYPWKGEWSNVGFEFGWWYECMKLWLIRSASIAYWLRRWILNPGSHVQNHWVAPRLTQSFILLRSIKWVPGISGNLVVKSKLPPRSGSSFEAVEPHPSKRAIKFFKVLFLLEHHSHQKILRVDRSFVLCFYV